jgi:hypothetical protein
LLACQSNGSDSGSDCEFLMRELQIHRAPLVNKKSANKIARFPAQALT